MWDEAEKIVTSKQQQQQQRLGSKVASATARQAVLDADAAACVTDLSAAAENGIAISTAAAAAVADVKQRVDSTSSSNSSSSQLDSDAATAGKQLESQPSPQGSTGSYWPALIIMLHLTFLRSFNGFVNIMYFTALLFSSTGNSTTNSLLAQTLMGVSTLLGGLAAMIGIDKVGSRGCVDTQVPCHSQSGQQQLQQLNQSTSRQYKKQRKQHTHMYDGTAVLQCCTLQPRLVSFCTYAAANTLHPEPTRFSCLPMFTKGLTVISQIGRRPLLIYMAFAMAALMAAAAAILGTGLPSSATAAGVTLSPGSTAALMVILCFWQIAFWSSWGPCFYVTLSELYPLQTRARSVGWGMVTFNLGVTLVLSLGGSMLCAMTYGLLVFFASVNLYLGVFAAACLPEMRGKQLQEVAEVYRHHWLWKHAYRQRW